MTGWFLLAALLLLIANAFFVPVPEPGALALVGAAFLAVGVASKRRKSA